MSGTQAQNVEVIGSPSNDCSERDKTFYTCPTVLSLLGVHARRKVSPSTFRRWQALADIPPGTKLFSQPQLERLEIIASGFADGLTEADVIDQLIRWEDVNYADEDTNPENP